MTLTWHAPLRADERLEALAGRSTIVRLSTHYTLGQTRVTGIVRIDAPKGLWKKLSEAIARVVDLTNRQRSAYRVLLRLRSGRAPGNIWHLELPIQPGAAQFEIPVDSIAPGSYELQALVIGPQGNTRPIQFRHRSAYGTVTFTAAVPLVVSPARDTLIGTTLRNAPALLTKAIKVGHPSLEQFPLNDARDAYARGIHELHAYQGRIYVGYGDWHRNRGPIQVWSFSDPSNNGGAHFRKEIRVDDESVERFRTIDRELFVPGTDASDPVLDQWAYGNLYVKTDAGWQKLRTIPNGVHVFDVAALGPTLFVTTGTETGAALFASLDSGQTWQRHSENLARATRFREMTTLNDSLLITGERPELGAYRFRKGRLERLLIPLLPDIDASRPSRVHRLEQFAGGVVYTLSRSESDVPLPLFFLKDLVRGADVVALFQTKQVRDIVVRDGQCHVLVGQSQRNSEGGFPAAIYASVDLKAWVRVAEFTVPALATSMEILNGSFYVGLSSARPGKSAESASGSIWRVLK